MCVCARLFTTSSAHHFPTHTHMWSEDRGVICSCDSDGESCLGGGWGGGREEEGRRRERGGGGAEEDDNIIGD